MSEKEKERLEIASRCAGWLKLYGVVVLVTNQTPENRQAIERDFDKLTEIFSK